MILQESAVCHGGGGGSSTSTPVVSNVKLGIISPPPQLGYYKKDISKNRLFKTYISVFVACKKIAKGSVLETMTLEFVTWKLKIDPIEKERTRIFQITLW